MDNIDWIIDIVAEMVTHERQAQQRQSFEYLDDPNELIARRGSLSALAVA